MARRLASLEGDELELNATTPNTDAHRFYEREELQPVLTTFYGRLRRPG